MPDRQVIVKSGGGESVAGVSTVRWRRKLTAGRREQTSIPEIKMRGGTRRESSIVRIVEQQHWF